MTNNEVASWATLTLKTTFADGSIAKQHSLSPYSKTVIGRAPDCQITLDPQKFITVSRRHAEIKVVGDRWQIEDLGTTNGTLVNGSPISSSQLLESGDRITLGTTGPEFTFNVSPVIPFQETLPQLEVKSPTRLKLDMFEDEEVAPMPDTPAVSEVAEAAEEATPELHGNAAEIGIGRSLWNLIAVRELCSIFGVAEPQLALALSSDGQILASATSDKTVKLWNVVYQTEIATLTGHEQAVNALAFSRDRQILASGSQNGSIKLWNVGSQTEIATLTGHEQAVNALAFSFDGQILASGCEDRTIKLWNAATKEEIVILTSNLAVASLSFSPDDTTLASGNGAGTVELWNLTTKEEAVAWNHQQGIVALAFSPDGNNIASADAKGRIELWDKVARERIATLTVPVGHGAIAISADGRTIAGSDRQGVMRLWQIV